MGLNWTNYFFIAFLLVIMYMSFLILKPFILVILTSFVIASVFYSLYKKILKKTKRENLSAFIVSFLIILIITIPTLLIVNMITKEVTGIYSDIAIKLTQDEDLIRIECDTDSVACDAIKALNKNNKVRFYISGAITNIASTVTRNTSAFLFSLPKKIIDVLIIFLLVFFLLKGGNTIWDELRELLPLKESHKNKLLKKFSDTLDGVVYGYLIVAFVEAIIGWIAFLLVGSKIALVLGLIIGILALIPMVGASIVWVPASIIYFLGGSPIKGIILVAFGLIIMFLDIWTRAQLIGKWTDIHPAVIALGVLGGIITFGPVGVVIGPVILSLLITSFEIFQIEKKSFIT